MVALTQCNDGRASTKTSLRKPKHIGEDSEEIVGTGINDPLSQLLAKFPLKQTKLLSSEEK